MSGPVSCRAATSDPSPDHFQEEIILSELLYILVSYVARIHNWILTWNDSSGAFLDDKQLHFIVMGVVGMLLLFVVYPLFKVLSENHILVVAWIYVFTVMFVLTFAIEIGQGITGTGRMEMDDVTAGLAGFMFLFFIFAAIRLIVVAIVDHIKDDDRRE